MGKPFRTVDNWGGSVNPFQYELAAPKSHQSPYFRQACSAAYSYSWQSVGTFNLEVALNTHSTGADAKLSLSQS